MTARWTVVESAEYTATSKFTVLALSKENLEI